jgi:hypothetical protein
MSGFLHTSNSTVATPTYSGLQLQTSSNAIPISIVWGVNKIAPNIMWNGNFHSSTSGGSGKGGALSSSKDGSSTTTYYAAVMLGLCEGPIVNIASVFDNSTITSLGSVSSLPSPTLFTGTTPQDVWDYLTSGSSSDLPWFERLHDGGIVRPGQSTTDYSSQALAYNGLAYIADYQANLGSSATLDSYSVEVAGIGLLGFNSYDGDPARIIYDFLTNPQYGVGFPASSIDTASLLGTSGDGSLQSYCFAAGLALSPALTSQEAADSILTRWLQLINCAAFWSEGQLKFKPYGDAALTGPLYNTAAVAFGTSSAGQSYANPYAQSQTGTYAFTPDLTPIYDLTDDDYMDAGTDTDPVIVKRTDPYAAYNWQSLEIAQRSNFYDATPINVFDQNAIDLYGLRIAPTVTAHEICDAGIGQTAAQLILQRGLYIRATYEIKGSWELCLLEPMDLITLTDAAIGLNQTVIRITAIEEDDQGFLTVTAEEFPNGVATASEYAIQQKTSSGISAGATAAAVNTPLIFEPPYQEANELAIWIAASGQDLTAYGGCYVWFSQDGTSFSNLGALTGSAATGKLTADLAPVSVTVGTVAIDATNQLKVDLSSSGGTLSQASAADMNAGNSACYLGTGEIIAYQNATLTGTDLYTLSPLQRGAFDSTVVAAPAGTAFASLSAGIFKQAYQSTQIGKTVYFKFQSFNPLGGGLLPLAECAAYPYKITGSPLAAAIVTPQNVVLTFTGGIASIAFDTVSDFRSGIRYQIAIGDTAATAQLEYDVAHGPVAISRPGTFFVRAYCNPAAGITAYSAWSAPVTVSGTVIIENNLESFDQQAEGWQGTLVNLTVSGVEPDQILLLAGAASVDFGLASEAVTTSDDFGLARDDEVIAILDLGSVT